MDSLLLIFILLIAIIITFIESAFKMGYGLFIPILILFGFEPLDIIPTLLFCQLYIGLTKTIFHYIYSKREFPTLTHQNRLVISLFFIFGFFGVIAGFIVFYFSTNILIKYYIIKVYYLNLP